MQTNFRDFELRYPCSAPRQAPPVLKHISPLGSIRKRSLSASASEAELGKRMKEFFDLHSDDDSACSSLEDYLESDSEVSVYEESGDEWPESDSSSESGTDSDLSVVSCLLN